MNETTLPNSMLSADSASDAPMTAQEWADMRIPAMEFTIPDKVEFLADAEKQSTMLPFLRSVLTRDDHALENASRAAPEAHLKLLEWFNATATDYENNALMMRRAAYRLLGMLTRLEVEAAQ